MSPVEVFAELLNASVDDVAGMIILLLTALAGIGLLAKASVDVIKLLLQPRVSFHRYYVSRFLDNRQQSILEGAFQTTATSVEERILQLSTGGEAEVLYYLPTETLIQKIKSAISIVLMDIHQQNDEEFIRYWCLAQPADITRLKTLRDLRFCFSPGGLTDAEKDELDRLETLVEAHIDSVLAALQIKMEFYWHLLMTTLAMLISLILTLGLVNKFILSGQLSPGWIIFAIAAGMFAPFAHDLLASFRKIIGR